ncbi:unnamed protein product [Kuraishia capsulata CBS 1993]|uniref:AN1-type domain-containing protein n=1 Tax=Kuraishia capsulata CBS 1993 TaxID=1382522 RepID=W6MGU9_9ASCO|nr:uncharacterized protein KUCA_T00001063001 [Kuraishia capsulata CBS 1993]CDK25096.1 unnamed protein product [Kuraishia capsulata CBS 1993]
MELQSSLHSYGITPVSNSTVYLTNGSQSDESAVAEDAMTDVAVEVAAAEAKSKIRRKSANKRKCSSRGCTSAPLRIVGDCSLCQGKFCSKHRLLENHNCSGLQSCKDQMHERNALKLQSEQTVASKV